MQQKTGSIGIAEAASRLRVSTDTVRRRLKARTIQGVLENGKWAISLPAGDTELQGSQDDLVEALQHHIANLEHAVAEKDRQITELHAILTRATTPALPKRARSWWHRALGK